MSRRGADASDHSKTLEDNMTPERNLTENASQLGNDAKESIEEFGQTSGRKMDEAREEAAGALHSAASSVRSAGRRGSAAIGNISAGAADRLDSTAAYVADHNVNSALVDLRKFARRNLAVSLVMVGAVGFLAGSAIGRATHNCAGSAKG